MMSICLTFEETIKLFLKKKIVMKNPIISITQCKNSTFKSATVNRTKWHGKHTMKGTIIS